MTAVSSRSLHKTFSRGLFRRGGHAALRGLELDVPRGSAFGLIGPNGAGKTTFIKTLLGIARPTSGEVTVLGGAPEDPEVRARIGYLPERLHLPSSFTPLQFLRSVARLKGLSGADGEVHRLLGRVGLAADSSRKIGGFSKGMKQRLGLAAALLGSPELLILDEPTDGVDPVGRVEIRKLLAEEHARGTTLFLNSHLLSETERVCDRIGLLVDGRIVKEGPIDALMRERHQYRVRLAGTLDSNALSAAGLQPVSGTGDTFLIAADSPEALNAAVDAVRRSGALLLELQPVSRDLEAILTDALRERAAA